MSYSLYERLYENHLKYVDLHVPKCKKITTYHVSYFILEHNNLNRDEEEEQEELSKEISTA